VFTFFYVLPTSVNAVKYFKLKVLRTESQASIYAILNYPRVSLYTYVLCGVLKYSYYKLLLLLK
jgi:hypothetical protein